MDSDSLGVFHVAALLLAGFIAGFMNTVAGGGTLVTFPTLVFMGLPSIVANATSTVALLPAALSGVVGYRNRLSSVAGWLRLFAPVSLVGGLLGGILLVQTPSQVFDGLVPFLILFATILFMANSLFTRFFRTREVGLQGASPSRSWMVVGVLFQLAVAVYGGYFGAGIGILMLASLGILGFEDVHQMNLVKVVLGFLINVVAALYFIAFGLIHWPSAGIMIAGTIAGGYTGARIAQRIPQTGVRALITAIGIIISVIMFYKQFGPH